MRILVTGANGFLGYHLTQRLLAEGHAVTALHRPGSRLDRIRELGVRFADADLAVPDSLTRAIAGHDAVIHAAADISYWSAHASLQEQVNAVGSRNVARASRLAGAARLLHVSSTAAVGIPFDAGHPANESFAFNLSSTGLAYHLSKRRGEEAVLEEAAQGLNAVVVNPSSIFGPHGNHYRGGEMIGKVAKGRFAPYFTGGISAVHVADVVEGCLSALDRGVKGERYILAGENLSFREIARRSLEAQGVRRPLLPVPPLLTGILALVSKPIGRLTKRSPRFNPAIHYSSSRFQYYSPEKARQYLGYNPRGFDAILQEWMTIYRPLRRGTTASL